MFIVRLERESNFRDCSADFTRGLACSKQHEFFELREFKYPITRFLLSFIRLVCIPNLLILLIMQRDLYNEISFQIHAGMSRDQSRRID